MVYPTEIHDMITANRLQQSQLLLFMDDIMQSIFCGIAECIAGSRRRARLRKHAGALLKWPTEGSPDRRKLELRASARKLHDFSYWLEDHTGVESCRRQQIPN